MGTVIQPAIAKAATEHSSSKTHPSSHCASTSSLPVIIPLQKQLVKVPELQGKLFQEEHVASWIN